MSYIINKSNGELLTELIDGTIDQDATNLTLIGKNVSGYGDFINENFLRLLENFANSSPPDRPILGQLWFDTTENRIKVYNGSGFSISSASRISDTRPTDLSDGDFWINATENQLYFFDGQDTVLVGPSFKTSQGISGFEVETITDINGYDRVIVKLWVAQELLGIFSKETTEFFPMTTIAGFTGSIKPGFNQSTLPGLKFNATATSAEQLVSYDINGDPVYRTPSSFVTTESDSTIVNSVLTIQNFKPLVLGSTNNTVNATEDEFNLTNTFNDQNFAIKTKGTSDLAPVDALKINASTKRIGVFNSSPAYTLDVNGGISAGTAFRLPRYTTAQRDLLPMSSSNNGELIYNLTTNKVQAYADGSWVDLH